MSQPTRRRIPARPQVGRTPGIGASAPPFSFSTRFAAGSAGQGFAVQAANARGHAVASVEVRRTDGRAAELVNLRVAPEVRRMGLGSQLVQAAMRQAAQQGIARLELEARPSHGSTIPQAELVRFYARLGFHHAGVSQRGNPIMRMGPPASPAGRAAAAQPKAAAPAHRRGRSDFPGPGAAQRSVVTHRAGQPRHAAPPAAPSSRHAATGLVVQRMESPWSWLKKGAEDLKKGATSVGLTALTAGASVLFKYPNPIEMPNFTSCVCLVFNTAGRTDRNYITDTSRQVIFDSIEDNWTQHHSPNTFFHACPFDENDSPTTEWTQLMMADMATGILGNRPLIVIIGHCSPGSSVIQSDDGREYKISDVIQSIRPFLKHRCTIYLTPCNTGIASKDSPSFQDQFTNAMIRDAAADPNIGNSERLIVATQSVSVPAKGKVLTTGQSYSRVKTKAGALHKLGAIDEKEVQKPAGQGVSARTYRLRLGADTEVSPSARPGQRRTDQPYASV